MGLIFYDAFPYADGPLVGNGGWLTLGGTWNVASTIVKQSANNYSLALNPSNIAGPDQVIEALIPYPSAYNVGIAARSNVVGTIYYALTNEDNGNLLLWRRAPGHDVLLGTAGYRLAIPQLAVTLTLAVVGTSIRAYVDRQLVIDATDAYIATGNWAGLVGCYNTAWFKSFSVYNAPFGIPQTIQGAAVAGGPSTTIGLVASGTAWTPGTPGSPVFTPTLGTITAQTITSPTAVSLTYTPPAAVGEEQFNADGLLAPAHLLIGTLLRTDLLDVVALLASAGAGAVGFDPAAVVQLNGLAGLTVGGFFNVISQLVTIIDFLRGWNSEPPSGADLTALWNRVSFLYIEELFTGTPPHQSLYDRWVATQASAASAAADAATAASEATDAATDARAMRGDADWTLAQVRSLVTGDNLTTNDGLALDIAAVRGDGVWDLDDVYTWVHDIRTDDNWSLESVRLWIAAIPTVDLSGVLSAIETVGGLVNDALDDISSAVSTLQGNISSAVSTLQGNISSAVSTLQGNISDVRSDVAAVRGAGSPDLAELLTAIQGITGGGGGAPVWPGEAGVTYQTSIPVTGEVVIEGNLDGFLLILSHLDKQVPSLSIGGAITLRNLGRVAFLTETGATEPWQPIPSLNCLMVPKAIAHPAGCLVGFYQGVTGLLTPWTVNA